MKNYRLKIPQLFKGRAELVSGGGMLVIMVSDGDGTELTSKFVSGVKGNIICGQLWVCETRGKFYRNDAHHRPLDVG